MSSSKVLTIVSLINESLKNVSLKTPTAVKFKDCILTNFTKRFKNAKRIRINAIATIVDPRFKKLYFSDPLNALAATKDIEKMLPETLLSQQSLSGTSSKIWSNNQLMIESRSGCSDLLSFALKNYLSQLQSI